MAYFTKDNTKGYSNKDLEILNTVWACLGVSPMDHGELARRSGIQQDETRMPLNEFNDALATIGWTRFYLSKVLECNPNIPSRWSDGTAAIPRPISAWLRALAVYHRLKPPPRDWRKRGAGDADRHSQDTPGNPG